MYLIEFITINKRAHIIERKIQKLFFLVPLINKSITGARADYRGINNRLLKTRANLNKISETRQKQIKKKRKK